MLVLGDVTLKLMIMFSIVLASIIMYWYIFTYRGWPGMEHSMYFA